MDRENMNSSKREETSSSQSPAETDGENVQEHAEIAEKLEIQPFCQCRNCHHWTTSVDWCPPPSQLDFNTQVKQPVCKNKVKPILREEPLENHPRVCSLYTTPEFTSTGQSYRVLVHGQIIPQPIKTVAAAYFNEDIQQSLKNLGYVHSKPIQAFAWPAVFRQMNLMMVGSQKCGKTMGYLPAICTFALQIGEKYSEFSKYKGPLIVILCSNTKRCEETFELMKKLLPVSAKKLKVALVAYPSYKMQNVDVLVTLPQILLENLKAKVFNLKRLCHLVLEDANLMLRDNETDLYDILRVADDMLQHRVCNETVQVVITADRWTEQLDVLLKKMYWMPLVCFEDCFEAMLYGQAEFEIKFLNKIDKKCCVWALLKDKYRTHKTVIICEDFELTALQVYLTKKGIDVACINDSATKEKMDMQEYLWKSATSGHYKVLLCTSFVLDTLINIRDAMWLIHYSFPSTWTRFSKRFVASTACIRSPLKSAEDKVECKSIMLFDEDSFSSSSLKLIRTIDAKLLSRLKNSHLPDSYKQLMAAINSNYELEKIEEKVALCPKLKLFGKCTDATSCDSRHTIDADLDVRDDLPKNGKIKFKILKFLDVTKYTIQILEHVSMTGTVTKYHAEGKQPLVYESEELRVAEHAEVGRHYAQRDVDFDQETFAFCELERVMKEDFIEVRLANGRVVHTARKNLYDLPRNFKVVDMHLANLLPPYKDTGFCNRAYNSTRQVLDNISYKDIVLTGDVLLQIDNTLWLDKVIERVSMYEMEFVKTNVMKCMKFANLVVHDDKQIKLLRQLCIDCEVSLPNYEMPKPKTVATTTKLTPQEAFLDKDEINEVCLSYVVSPDNFFVRLLKFDCLLKNLEDELQTLKLKDVSVDVGKYYLAFDPNTNQYGRVLVLGIDHDDVECFFVDYGEENIIDKANIKHMPSRYLYKLPFQAIQCRLHGVEPLFDNWNDDAGDIIYRYLLIPDYDVFRSLFAKVCETYQSSTIRTRKTYSILLKDGFGDKNVLINKLLVDTGVALPIVDEEICNFELPFRPQDQGSDHEDDWQEEQVDHVFTDADVVESNGEPEDLPYLDENEFEFFIDGDIDAFLNKRLGIPINTLLASEQVQKIKPNEQKTMERKLLAIEDVKAKSETCSSNRSDDGEPTKSKSSECLIPEVYWSQTSTFIRMKIMLIGVADYKINLIKRRILSFSTRQNEKMYELKLTFYKTVEIAKHSGGGQEIRVVLKKTEEVEWPQLTVNKKRLRNIHYEFTEDELKDAPGRKFLQLDISDVESDGEDIMYHNAEDQLSDYDKDVMSSDSDCF